MTEFRVWRGTNLSMVHADAVEVTKGNAAFFFTKGGVVKIINAHAWDSIKVVDEDKEEDR